MKTTVLGDTANMKRLLDDHVAEVLQSELKYEEDVGMSNIKLIVGFSGVLAGLISHVYPKPFPANWWVLLACCIWYFAMSGILQLILSYMELEAFLQLKPKSLGAPGLNIASNFPRFTDKYVLAVTPLPKGSLGMLSAPKFNCKTAAADGVHHMEVSVTRYFDEDGVFHEDVFGADVRKFIAGFEAKHTKKTQ